MLPFRIIPRSTYFCFLYLNMLYHAYILLHLPFPSAIAQLYPTNHSLHVYSRNLALPSTVARSCNIFPLYGLDETDSLKKIMP